MLRRDSVAKALAVAGPSWERSACRPGGIAVGVDRLHDSRESLR